LQERLLEVSAEITRQLSLLQHNIEAVPAEERASLLMAVMQITATQRSLSAHTDHVPSAWQRLDALRATLEMLEATLDHLSNIANAHPSSGQPSAAPRALLPRRRERAGRNAEHRGPLAKSLERSRHILNGAWLRLLGLLVMLLAGAAISYGMFPQASQYSPAANPAETSASSVAAAGGDAVAVSPTPRLGGAIERPATVPVSAPVPPQVREGSTAIQSEATRPAPTGLASGIDWPMPGMVVAMRSPPSQAAPMERASGEGASKALQVGPTPEPEAATAFPGSSGFVPVVFTHRDGGVATRAFADLQRRYPKLLGHHRGEPQPIDLGSKGVWHRLVVLPAVSRPEATKLCEQLATAGYDRCWVKAF
jgi:hypothetical protein